MMMHEPLHFTGLRGKLAHGVPLAKHTSWRTGGPADTLFVPADRDDLAAFLRQLPAAEPLTVLGLGSNTLVRDGGVRGTVVVLHNPGAAVAVVDGLVYADAALASPKLARFAANHGCAEAEFLAGIPGSVGGALAMNAGCYGGETWRYGARVEVVTRDGRFAVRLPEGDAAAARARIKDLLARRIAAQPLSLPNAGSVFRNPPGDHAARLIESCGLKGFALGGVRVSEKHANFIVNPRGAGLAADIEALIAHVRATVRDRTGVDLEPEVRIVGEQA